MLYPKIRTSSGPLNELLVERRESSRGFLRSPQRAALCCPRALPARSLTTRALIAPHLSIVPRPEADRHSARQQKPDLQRLIWSPGVAHRNLAADHRTKLRLRAPAPRIFPAETRDPEQCIRARL